MITCFSTLGCPELTIAEIMSLAQRHGIRQIEIRALAGGLAIADALAREFGTPARLREALDRSGLRIVVFGMSLRSTEPQNRAHRGEIEEILPWSEGVRGAILRIFDGCGGVSATGLACARDNLAWWDGLVRERSLRSSLAIETHDSLLDVEALDRFLRVFPSASILWDTHHTWRKGKCPLPTIWRRVAANVVHLHVKDSVTAASDPAGFRYVVPGTGEFPFGELREILNASTFGKPVSLEWEKHWHPELADLDVALDAVRSRGLSATGR